MSRSRPFGLRTLLGHPETRRAAVPRAAFRANRSFQHAPLFDLFRLRRGVAEREANEAAIRHLAHAVGLGGDTALCRALGRYKMFVDTQDAGLAPHLMLDGFWEMWVTEAMTGFVRGGMVAVDAGANLGYYTLLLADLVGPCGRVHAAEPNPRMASLLERSVQANGFRERVTLHDRPLSAQDGERVALRVSEDMPQNAHIVPAEGEGALVTTTIDDIVGDGPCDFVKIDAEGAELAIWQGMRRVLARRRPLAVFLEFNADRYADPAGFLDEMMAAGFAMSSIDPIRGVVPIVPRTVLARDGTEDWMIILAR